MGLPTIADALDKLPSAARQLEEARAGIACHGVKIADGAPLADALQQGASQGMVMAKVHHINHAAFLRQLSLPEAADMRGAGGSGSSGFLGFPTEAACSIEDADWTVALRKRLRCKRAECSQAELAKASNTCRLMTAEGVMCNQPLDEMGFHSCTCQSQGGVLKRHGRVIRGVGSLVSRWKRAEPLYEQRVPSWDRPSRSRLPDRPCVERAILDIEYAGEDGRTWMDISIRHSAAGSHSELNAAARRNGEAARRGERAKHARYPGERLCPFVLECGGRWGGGASVAAPTGSRASRRPSNSGTKPSPEAH